MMKRMLSLLLAALLVLTLLPAIAEEAAPQALYRIVKRTYKGDETLGSAVLFGSDTMLLTGAQVWAEGELYAIGADGEHAITWRGTVADSQLALLGMATASAAPPRTVTQADHIQDHQLYGVNAQGEFVGMTVVHTRRTVIDGRAEVLLHAEDGMMPGAIMLGADGNLAALAVSLYGEGLGVYTALANVTLDRLLTGMAGTSTGLLHGVTLKCEKGVLTVDWSEAYGCEVTEDSIVTVYMTAMVNPYLSYEVLTEGETSATFPALPGTQVAVWVAVSTEELAEPLYPETDAQIARAVVPEAESFSGYGLRNLCCGVTWGEPGLEGAPADFLPQQPLTRETLSDPDAAFYFQTEDTYQVDEEDDDHVLLVALYTPEGYVFYYYSGYIFMPEYGAGDLWIADSTGVIRDYARFGSYGDTQAWPAGEYAFVYYIDGGEVARIPFTLD